jgi:hypothetical protein
MAGRGRHPPAGDELAEFPEQQERDGGHQRPGELPQVDLRGPEQAIEHAQLGDHDGEDELSRFTFLLGGDDGESLFGPAQPS